MATRCRSAGIRWSASSYSQDDNANYEDESAIVDVFKDGKFVTTMYPERRFYKASQQASTMVANHSMPSEDLYLVYTGRNEGSDKPILRVHLNPARHVALGRRLDLRDRNTGGVSSQ